MLHILIIIALTCVSSYTFWLNVKLTSSVKTLYLVYLAF